MITVIVKSPKVTVAKITCRLTHRNGKVFRDSVTAPDLPGRRLGGPNSANPKNKKAPLTDDASNPRYVHTKSLMTSPFMSRHRPPFTLQYRTHAIIRLLSKGGPFMNFTLISALIFVAALILVTIVGIGERKKGHARDDD